jgi:hypothetical protein
VRISSAGPGTGRKPSCRSIPPDPTAASNVVLQLLAYFGGINMSWTAAAFEVGNLILGFDTYSPTLLDRPWTCGALLDPGEIS